MEAREIIHCQGHTLIRACHPTTFEVTRESHLSTAGDCIIGVAADKGAADLSASFKEVLRTPGAVLLTHLRCGPLSQVVHASGSPSLALDHPRDLVWRRSSFTCARTVAIGADTVAATIRRDLVAALQQGGDLTVELVAISPGIPY